MRIKRIQIAKLRSSPEAVMVVMAVAIFLLSGGLWYLHSSRPVGLFKWVANITDDQVVEDLVTLEKALLSYEGNPGDPPGILPNALGDMRVQGLHGNLKGYSYRVRQQAVSGAPGTAYDICAYFRAERAPGAHNTFIEPSTEGYIGHRAGEQCFTNSYYKGASHINRWNR